MDEPIVLNMRGPVRALLTVHVWWKVQRLFGRGPYVTYQLPTPEEMTERIDQMRERLRARGLL